MQKKVIKTNDLMMLIIESINEQKEVKFMVVGSSMEPFFKSEVTDVKLINHQNILKKYDVILFKYENTYKLHRIIKIKDHQIIASGDNLLSEEVIDIDDVIGVVYSFINNDKEIFSSQISYKLKYRLNLLFKPILVRLRRRSK